MVFIIIFSKLKLLWKYKKTPKQVIILAGGKGTRMHTNVPKCGYVVFGKPMIRHIMNACDKINYKKRIIVLGYKKEELLRIVKNKWKKYNVAIQEKQLGTADAVKCTKHLSIKDGLSVIIPGDMPLIDKEIMCRLMNEHINKKNNITVVTNIVNNPYGYGRIKRNEKTNISEDIGDIIKVIEENDCLEEERKINEVNSGVICINNNILYDLLEKVNNKNANNEYYLTDIINLAFNRYQIGSVRYKNDKRLFGINDLNNIRELYKK